VELFAAADRHMRPDIDRDAAALLAQASADATESDRQLITRHLELMNSGKMLLDCVLGQPDRTMGCGALPRRSAAESRPRPRRPPA
jgi:hypothetical protein